MVEYIEKDQILQNWHDYCQKKKEFDSCDFDLLLSDEFDWSEAELHEIFQYFSPHTEQLVARLNSLYELLKIIWGDMPPERLPKSTLGTLAKEDIREKIRVAKSHGKSHRDELNEVLQEYNLPEWLEQIAVEFTDDKAYFDQYRIDIDQPGSELNCYFGDAVIDLYTYAENPTEEIYPLRKYKYPCVFAIDEALYWLTKDYSLVYYVISPLCREPVNLDHYVSIRRSGSDYVLTEKGIIIYTP